MQEIPASVQLMIDSIDHELRGLNKSASVGTVAGGGAKLQNACKRL
jgi:hypothetical protein